MPDDKFNFEGFPDNEEFEPAPRPRRGGSFEDYLNSMGGPGMPGGMPPGMGLNIGINMDAFSDKLQELLSDNTSILTDFVEMLYCKNPTLVEQLFPGIGEAKSNECLMDFVEREIFPEFAEFQKLDTSTPDPKHIVHSTNLFSDMVDGLLQQMGIPSEILSQLGFGGGQSENEEPEDVEIFELGLTSYLFNNFGNFEYKNADVYKMFVDKYGEGPKWDSSIVSGSGVKILTTFEEEIDDILKSITAFKYVSHTDNYLLTFTEIDRPGCLGFFIVFTVNKDGEIVGAIPEFGNTLDYYPEDDTVFLYESGETELIDKKGIFTEMDMEKVIAGVNLMLAKVHRPLLSIERFGTVTNKRISMSNDSRLVELGTIKDNGSAEATLFKKDMDIPVEENEFRFAIRFKEILSDVARNYINDQMSAVNINDSFFAKYNELEAEHTENGVILFIDVDCENVERFIMQELKNRKGF